MKEAMLTVGMLLLFAGCLGAIAGSTLNTGPTVASGTCTQEFFIFKMQCLSYLLIVEIIFTFIAFVGGAMVLRNR
jgi:hypothetical protein